MPDVGTIVRMSDGRTAIVSAFTPFGEGDKVMFPDGHEESTNAWEIAEMLTNSEQDDVEPPADLLAALRTYLALVSR